MLSTTFAAAARSAVRAPTATMRTASYKPGATAPAYLDGSLPADVGCDPLCLAALATPVGVVPADLPKTASFLDRVVPFPWTVEQREQVMASRTPEEQQQTVQWMREAEIKHARLAMLAVVGWPLSELLNPFNALGFVDGRAPALLNGGLGAYAPFLLLAAAGAAFVEFQTIDDVNQTYLRPKQYDGYVPGDLGFDPLGLRDKVPLDQAANEIYNGRLAMLAITGFAAQEFLWGKPIVEQTPLFFKPAFF